MNVQQKVSALEALLARVQRNAAAPRPARTRPAPVVAAAPAAPVARDTDLPAELAHAVFSPAPTPKPAEVAAKPAAAAPARVTPDAAPESKPKLVALAPPLASAARSMTPAYGTSAQKQPVEPRQPTPKAPAVAPGPRPATPAAKPAAASPKPEPAAARAVTEKPPAAPSVAPAATASAPPAVGRAGSRTLMGTGLTELRAALAEVTQPRKPAELSKLVADESTGEGATLVRESPLKGGDDDGEYDSESTRLMPQPTQEELIAASQRFKGAPLDDDSTGEGATLVRESPLVAGSAVSPTPPAAAAKPAVEASPRVEVRTPAARVAAKPVVTAPPEPAFATTAASEADPIAPKARPEPAVHVGKAGTAIMDVSPIAAAAAPLAAPPPMPAIEPRAASTPPPMPVVASAAAAPAPAQEPVAPAPPPPVPMPSAPPPSVPSFMQPGGGSVRPAPMPEPLPPPKKRGIASMFGVGLAAAALVAAGGWLALRNGWIADLGPLGSLVGGPPHPTATPSGSAAPSAAPSAKASASAAPKAARSAETAAAPSAAASAAPSAPNATPSATPSAAPAAGADASALPARQGYLVVTSAQAGTVYINAKPIGELGSPIAVPCGIKFIRLGTANGKAPPQFIGPGRSINVLCRKTTETTLPGPATAAPAGQAPATADAPAPVAPDL
ncbi:MAG TPA: hypothetical protein VGM56_23650 [Byssovorax sp.]